MTRAASSDGMAAREREAAEAHYDDRYFRWYAPLGEFGGWANRIKFEEFVGKDDAVLDFGCGGGYLLKQLDCARKLGIDINAAARAEAARQGITAVASAADVDDDWADLIISNNALEHTAHPLGELQALRPKVRPGGRVVFVVPNESIKWAWAPGDINQHLYSWSPMSIGNLFTHAGFEVVSSEPFLHKWPRHHYRQAARLGARLFHLTCRLYARLERSWFQVRVVGRRPADGA